MRLLIAYEDCHRVYGDALQRAIRGLRPSVEVSLVQARELAGEVGRPDPHLVVCGKPNTVDPGGRAAFCSERRGDLAPKAARPMPPRCR